MKEKITDNSSLKIGIAEVDYTPEVGLDLVGNYRGDDYASRGIHDPLFGRAIVAADGGGVKAAILSIDICWMSREPVEFLRNYIAEKTDIRPENIMIHATHTHSGPKSDLDAPKAREYLCRAADAVILANQDLAPANLYAGRATEDRVSFNRRLECTDGTTHMCWENLEEGFVKGPLGPIDPELLTFSIDRDGKPPGVLVNFGCHVTTLTGNNWLYSSDYPGYLAESLRRIKGEDYMPVFLNGCCGNVTQVDYRVGFIDTYQECQRIGYMLGVAAVEAINNQEPVSGDTVAVSTRKVSLKHVTISEERLAWAKDLKEKIEREGMPPLQPDGIPDEDYALQWLKLHETQDETDSLEVMVIRIADLAFVALPGEMFAEYGLDIKTRSPFRNTIVMGITNDYAAYFPTLASYTEGPEGFTPMITGYETTPGTSLYEEGAGEKLADSAVEQLNELYNK